MSQENRLQITLGKELHDLLTELGKYQKRPASKVAREILTECMPALHMVLKAHKALAAKENPANIVNAAKSEALHAVGLGLVELSKLDNMELPLD